jgi:tetratricopeptide (TPR) repeat protein
MLPTWPVVLLIAATAAVEHDGWTSRGAGCPLEDASVTARPNSARVCAAIARRENSRDAALRSAYFYRRLLKFDDAQSVLLPFASLDDPMALSSFAFVDSLRGAVDRAMEEYQRAIDASEHVADFDARAGPRSQLGYELYRKSRYAESIRMLDGVVRTYSGRMTGPFERVARLNLSRALEEMGDVPAAEAEFERFREFLDGEPMSSVELLFDGRLHKWAGELESADELFKKAQRAARREGNRLNEGFAVERQFEIAVKRGDWKRAHALAAEMRVFEDGLPNDFRRQLVTAEAEQARGEGHLEESLRLFEQARGMSPPPNEVWELDYQSGRTRQALGLLSEARESYEKSITDVETQRKDSVDSGAQAALVGSRRKPYEALFELFAASGDGANALQTLQKALQGRLDVAVAEASDTAGHAVEDALNRNADLQSLHEADRALPERRGTLEDRQSHFVAFVTTDSHAWSVLHTEGKTLVEQLPLSPKELCDLMRKFGEDFDDASGARLGNALFPLQTLARLGERFAIILPSCARSFPVTAVPIDGGRLVNKAVVSIASDVSTVTWSDESGLRESNLVLADPFGDLPSAREEAQRTAQLTGAVVLVGSDASFAPLQTSGRHLLHFATHTGVDVAGPTLLLADRKFSVADILKYRVHADLVVLAGCHSGSKLEGTVAETLSTAFLRAGSGAVLATLQSVEDGYASEVVRAFYEEGGAADPAGALARVQRRLAQTESPARWSAFFVAGSPEPLTRRAPGLRKAQAFRG